VAPEQPNEVWASDFKGEFRVGDGSYCYPLTVTDSHSRYLLGCKGLSSTSHEASWRIFKRLFQEYGLPDVMLTDNGVPFGTEGMGGMSRLSVWWIRLGIVPVRIEPGNPQQNGRHERMHRTLKAGTACPPGKNLADQQGKFDAFRERFNDERPHAALGNEVPAEHYRPSSRALPRKLPAPEYPGHFEVRRVGGNGTIKWGNREHFLTTVLSGERVGLEEIEDGVWSLCLASQVLARYDERREQWTASNRPLCWLPSLALRARSESQQSGAARG
jgi:hypothetical protein